MITVGILVAYLADLGFSDAGLGWPPMFAVAIIPAAALGIGMFFLHDTPRWLASKGRWDEATAVMRRVVPTGTEEEMGRIKTRLEDATHASTHELFHGGLRVALIVAVGLAVLQQLAVVQIVFVWFLVPETKGKLLEAIEAYWQHGRSWAQVDGAAGAESDHM